jgi:nucleoside-diphosphate-sugar epimerase
MVSTTSASHDLGSVSVLLTGGTGFVGRAIRTYLASFPNFKVYYTGTQVPAVPLGPNEEFIKWRIGEKLVASECDYIIHCATPASTALNLGEPRRMFTLILDGALSVTDLAEQWQNKPRIMFTSSGAVYGQMPIGIERFEESCLLANDPRAPGSAYSEGKRVAEMLFAQAFDRDVLRPVYCRLFAFSGTYLPLNRHFAIGNFVRDAALSTKIVVKGSGIAIRSYLDQTDLAAWCLAALLHGKENSVFHIGSERSISILQLADLVSTRAHALFGKRVEVEHEIDPSIVESRSRYLPSTKWTRSQLEVTENISLEDSIDAMLLNAVKAEF